MKNKMLAVGICSLLLLVVFSSGCIDFGGEKEEVGVDIKITSATADVYESWWDYKADVTVKIANYGDKSASANSVTITVQSWSSATLYDEKSATYNQVITSNAEFTDVITVDVDDNNVNGTHFKVILFYNNEQVDEKTVYG